MEMILILKNHPHTIQHIIEIPQMICHPFTIQMHQLISQRTHLLMMPYANPFHKSAYHHHPMYRWRSSLYCNCIKAIHLHHCHQLLKREFHINGVPIAVRIGSDYPTFDIPSARTINIRINTRGKGYEVIKPYEAISR